jgi:hypothetical protein
MMMMGTQEIIAIMLVIAVIGFALYRRLRKKSASTDACSGCEHTSSKSADEKPVHFFKKQH